jgi:hypothetical protein
MLSFNFSEEKIECLSFQLKPYISSLKPWARNARPHAFQEALEDLSPDETNALTVISGSQPKQRFANTFYHIFEGKYATAQWQSF